MKSNPDYELLSKGDIDQGTLEAALRHRSFDVMTGVLGWILGLMGKEFRDFTLRNRSALEIGTGKFLNHALALYICGCGEVISVDKYRQLLPAAVKISMKRPILARRFLSGQVSHDDFMERLKQIESTGYDPDMLENLGITYRAPFDLLGSEPLRDQFDFVFSYTVFEHVPQEGVKQLLNVTCSALKPGGFCAHFIDLEDHLNAEADPFAFLSAHLRWSSEDTFNRGNRLRFSSWKRFFNQRDDMVCRFPYVAVRNDKPLPENINGDIQYLNEQDLRTTAFLIVGKRGK